MSRVEKFIIDRIQVKDKIPEDCDHTKFDYVKEGYIDSIGLMKYIIDIETEFDIEIEENEILMPEFRTIKGIINLIEQKMAIKG